MKTQFGPKRRLIEASSIPATGGFVFRMPGVRALRIPLVIPRPNNVLSSTILLAYGFAALIILGTILLVIPVSSRSGDFTSPITALFTSASAVCVTGLVVVDTGTYWSTFGQAVLFVLFQIGGVGFVVGATLLLLAIGGGFGLKDRLFIGESLGVDGLGGILGLVLRVAVFSLVVESVGAMIFYFHWAAIGDTGTSLWTAVFHAASAFNNCGMDIFGNFKSLQDYQGDATILLVTALLITFGSIGYVVIADCFKNLTPRRLSLDSKIVLVTSFSIIILGAFFYLAFESAQPATLGPLPFPQKIAAALFQSITPRTAGFSAIDIGSLQQLSLFFTILLMCVGGAAGSAAGGVKVNTIGVLAITAVSQVRGRENISVFGRQLTRQTIYRAITLLLFYLGFAGLVVTFLSMTEDFPIGEIIFEAFSALGTVGLTTGITPDLSVAGKFALTVTMFIGRLAPLALMAYLVHHRQPVDLEFPHENIRLG